MVSFELMLNGSLFGRIIPSRGLRQGGPLFPYLFIIGAKVLSLMLIKAEGDSLF